MRPTKRPTRPTKRPTKGENRAFSGNFGKIPPNRGLQGPFLHVPTKSGVFPTASDKLPTILQSLNY